MRYQVSALVLSSLISSVASAGDLTLQDVKAAIAKKGATWAAGETRVSGFSKNDKRKMMGISIREIPEDTVLIEESTMGDDLPESFDWRNVNGTSYASPILDQGACGSCVAFASVGTLETQMNIAQKTPSSPWSYSPQYLFSCGGGGCDRGWQPASAMGYLLKVGVPDEACFPYASGADGKDRSCTQACTDAKSRSHKITAYTSPSWGGTSVTDIKRALMKGPLLTTMRVFEDFMFYKGGVYRHVTGSPVGGHAISMVGWSDKDRAWIVRNSWNTTWGENGYFKIAWDDESGLGQQTWGMEVAPKNSYLTMGSLRDKALLAGTVKVPFEVVGADEGQIQWILRQNKKEMKRWDASTDRTIDVDTKSVADGVYELQAVATAAGKMVVSQPRVVHILNGKLTGSIQVADFTSGQVVRDKIQFRIGQSSAPVPFSKFTMTVRNVATGEIVKKRETENVGPQMTMSWQTKDFPNGDYDVVFVGAAGTQQVAKDPIRLTVQN